MDEQWCCEKLQSLNQKENRLNTLSEIQVHLNEAAHLETEMINRLLSSPELYDCLEESEKEQADIAADILSICMSNISKTQNEVPMLFALRHKMTRIKALALNAMSRELERHSQDDRTVLVSDNVLTYVLEAMNQEETEVGLPAFNILSQVLERKLEEQYVTKALSDMLQRNEIVKCRLYELAVKLACRSPEMLQKVEFLLDRALSELDNGDILLQVNILEILVSLPEQNHGLLYIEKRQVLEIVSKRIEAIEEHPLDSLLVPNIMKFFGKMVYFHPQKIIMGYPHVINCLFECIKSSDTTILPTAFDTFVNLLKPHQGKILVARHYSEPLRSVFEAYPFHLRNLSSDLKIRAFNTLEAVFLIEEAASSEVNNILQQWFVYLENGSNMQFLMNFCRNPFPDIKVACLQFMKSLCLFSWGIASLKKTAGFVEYLLDRKIEFDKEAKYIKYEIIKTLADCNAFDIQTNLQLRTYVNEGPYLIQSVMETAVEGN